MHLDGRIENSGKSGRKISEESLGERPWKNEEVESWRRVLEGTGGSWKSPRGGGLGRDWKSSGGEPWRGPRGESWREKPHNRGVLYAGCWKRSSVFIRLVLGEKRQRVVGGGVSDRRVSEGW